MLALGIDPGTDGAAALISVEESLQLFCPPLSFKYDPDWERKLFEWCVLYKPIVYKEAVHSMPGQGVATTFKFGFTDGAATAAVKVAGLDINYFLPQWWQKFLELPRHYDEPDPAKRRAKQRADQETQARLWYPGELGNWQKGGKKGQGDVFGGVLIARAGATVLLEQKPVPVFTRGETGTTSPGRIL